MAILLSDGLQINAGKHVDSRYLTTTNVAYSTVGQVNATIPISYRYLGLTVLIGDDEYWYKTGLTDSDLVLKSNEASVPYTAGNGISIGSNVVSLNVSNYNAGGVIGLTSTTFNSTSGAFTLASTNTGTISTTNALGVTGSTLNFNANSGGINLTTVANQHVNIIGGDSRYAADYSASYTPRSIPDVAWVTSQIPTNTVSRAGDTMIGPLIYTGTITNPNEYVTKSYVDAIAAGLNPRVQVAYTTDANITLSGLSVQGGGEWSGVLSGGERILVKNQSDPATNGFYISNSGAWTRATDMDVWSEVPAAYTFVQGGASQGTGWVAIANSSGTLGTDFIEFAQFNATTNYTADEQGLTLSATQFSLVLDGGTLSKSGTGLKVSDAGIGSTQIASSAVTYSKIQNIAASRLLGNPTGGAAAPSEILLGTNLSFVGSTLTLSSVPNITGINVGGNYTITLPTGVPTDGSVLKYNTIGGYTWGSVASSGGTVTSMSAGNLSPLFNSNVATATSTPSLTFSLINQDGNKAFMAPADGTLGSPTWRNIEAADLPDQGEYYIPIPGTNPGVPVSGFINFTYDTAGLASEDNPFNYILMCDTGGFIGDPETSGISLFSNTNFQVDVNDGITRGAFNIGPGDLNFSGVRANIEAVVNLSRPGGIGGSLRLRAPGSPYYIELISPALPASRTFTLPGSYPTVNGQVLSATTAGIMSWVTMTSGSGTLTSISGGTTGLTFSASPTTPVMSGTLVTANGGTGLTTIGTTGQGLVVNAAGTALEYQNILRSVDFNLAFVSGGIGYTPQKSLTFTAPLTKGVNANPDNDVIGLAGLTTVGTNGQVPMSNGSVWQYTTLATVATSGAYNDLTGKPTIPAQVNLIQGSNITITGTYPNLTINSSGGGGGGSSSMGSLYSVQTADGFGGFYGSDSLTFNHTTNLLTIPGMGGFAEGVRYVTINADGEFGTDIIPTPTTALTDVAFGASPNGNGGSISGNTITIQPASATTPGGVSVLAQSIAGVKTMVDHLKMTDNKEIQAVGSANFIKLRDTSDSNVLKLSANAVRVSSTSGGLITVGGGISSSGTSQQFVANGGGSGGISLDTSANSGGVTITTQAGQNLQISTGGFVVTSLAGSGTRMAVLDSSGKLGSQTLPSSLTTVAVGSTPNANGGSISGSTITLEPASINHPGIVSANSQVFNGAKTFNNIVTVPLHGTTTNDPSLLFGNSNFGIYVNGPGTNTGTNYLTIKSGFSSTASDVRITEGIIYANTVYANLISTFIQPQSIIIQPDYISSNYTVTDNDLILLVDATAGNITITLPDALIYRQYIIKKIDATVNTVTIDPEGTTQIEFASTKVLTTQGQSVTLTGRNTGTSHWYIIN